MKWNKGKGLQFATKFRYDIICKILFPMISMLQFATKFRYDIIGTAITVSITSFQGYIDSKKMKINSKY